MCFIYFLFAALLYLGRFFVSNYNKRRINNKKGTKNSQNISKLLVCYPKNYNTKEMIEPRRITIKIYLINI